MTNSLYAPVKQDKEPVVRLVIKLPESLREQFKALCQRKDVDMSVVLRRFMEQEVELDNAVSQGASK